MTDAAHASQAIHIHEDDMGMRCLHPLAAEGEVAADLDAAAAAGEANRAADGVGWTDIHLIASPQHDYAEAGLRLDHADAVLAPILPRVRRFVATAMAGFDPGVHDPFGVYEDDAYCYGFDASCFIKLEADGALVHQIWFQAETRDPERIAALRDAILAVDRLVPSVVADYWLSCGGAVGDPDFFGEYVRVLVEET